MQNSFTPAKSIKKSTSKASKSKLSKSSNYKIQSQSKNHFTVIKSITESQPYKNLLNKLLRCQNIQKFVSQASKYVDLSDQIIQKYKGNTLEQQTSRQQTLEYGKALIRDGSFIKFYCKLIQKQYEHKRKDIRIEFFQKYRHLICVREKMFLDYFKQENSCINEQSASYSFSKSKSNLKMKENNYPKQKSSKKASSQCYQKIDINDKILESLTTIDHTQSMSLSSVNSKSNTHSDLRKKQKTKKLSKEVVNQSPEFIYISPSRKYNKHETQEQRQLRFSGICNQSNLKSKSRKKNTNIVRFEDDLKQNQKLLEIYNQAVKIKQQREQLEQQSSTNKKSGQSVVVRELMKKIKEQVRQRKSKDLNQYQKSRLTNDQTEILSHYPQITKRATIAGVVVYETKVLGYFKQYLLKKASIRDTTTYGQPESFALIVQKPLLQLKENAKKCKFQYDQTISVIIFD